MSMGPNVAWRVSRNISPQWLKEGRIRCADPSLAAEYFWGMILHKPNAGQVLWYQRSFNNREQKYYVDKVVDYFISSFIEEIR